jgi:hypothetical protein
VAKISKNPPNNIDQSYGSSIVLDMGINAAYLRTKKSATIFDEARAYLFDPLNNYKDQSYTYVSECSNRGVCSRSSGLCTCFLGYKGDACQVAYNTV